MNLSAKVSQERLLEPLEEGSGSGSSCANIGHDKEDDAILNNHLKVVVILSVVENSILSGDLMEHAGGDGDEVTGHTVLGALGEDGGTACDEGIDESPGHFVVMFVGILLA